VVESQERAARLFNAEKLSIDYCHSGISLLKARAYVFWTVRESSDVRGFSFQFGRQHETQRAHVVRGKHAIELVGGIFVGQVK
jgi:hypothetical protein